MKNKIIYGDVGHAWRRRLAQIAATGACAALAACQSPGIGAAKVHAPGVITGRVKGLGTNSGPLVIVAVDRDSGRVAQRAFLARGDDYAIPMTAGRYKLYAFADLDRNGARSVGEPASLFYSISGDVKAGDRLELPALELGR